MKDVSEEIINGCRKKDQGCQKVVYETFYKSMYAICLRYAGNADEARDLLHDGFMKVFRKIDSFKGDSDFYYWIKRLFNNHCMDYVRSAYKKYLKYEDVHQMDLTDDQDTSGERNGMKLEDVIRLLTKLRPDYRAVINMYAIEGMSHEEIAERLNIKPVSSRSKLMRARNQLKELMEQHQVEQE